MLDKTYHPAAVEGPTYRLWEEAGAFAAGRPDRTGARPYAIVIPPPNVTGSLHMGHALNNTLQDVLVRYHRLRGREVCWVPGTDHGGIATQNVMEKQLKAEGKTRKDLGREKFLGRMQDWTRDCKKTILGQLTRLGCSLDFQREAFTMDTERAKAVYYAFKKFFKDGLIYRALRLVNWCVRCGTALSDIEVEHEEQKGKLWHIRYPVVGEKDRFLVIATTRPETMLADTAVAVHPKDDRYRDLHGKKVILPLVEQEIPVIADDYVDREFGTGALKITPYHDTNDWDVWQRHKDKMDEPYTAIGFDGKMTILVPKEFQGLSREKARVAVVEALKEKGLLEKEEKYKNAVGACYRCQQLVETLPSYQWFMKMDSLAKTAAKAVDDGRFKISPATWHKPYTKWLGEIQDWCLSRQIWWGHRIPVWYDVEKLADKLFVMVETPKGNRVSAFLSAILDEDVGEGTTLDDVEKRGRWIFNCVGDLPKDGIHLGPDRPAGSGRWLQDQDVLDTWFSSALWPFSVFGWPENTPDLKFYYPTSVLVTGYEILYLWVARMQMVGLHFLEKVPFPDCVLHGIVRDNHGKKMSKSLGNVVDPLIMMDKFGTDAFRFALISQAYPGKDIPFSEDAVTGPRNFANKIWNSTRFVLMNMPEKAPEGGWGLAGLDASKLDLADRWILAEYQATLARVHEKMEAYNTAAAADELYGFLWDKFCDWYVELAKARFEDPEGGAVVRTILVSVLTGTLKMLHPFMPFITEELYQALKPYSGESALHTLASGEPKLPRDFSDAEAMKEMGFLMDATRALRALRSQLNVPPGLKLETVYEGSGVEGRALVERYGEYIKNLARLKSLAPSEEGRPAQSATAVAGGLSFYVPLAGIIDLDKESKRLTKEIDRLLKDLKRCESQLGNRSFIERAPEAEVAKIRQRKVDFESKQRVLADTLNSLKGS